MFTAQKDHPYLLSSDPSTVDGSVSVSVWRICHTNDRTEDNGLNPTCWIESVVIVVEVKDGKKGKEQTMKRGMMVCCGSGLSAMTTQ